MSKQKYALKGNCLKSYSIEMVLLSFTSLLQICLCNGMMEEKELQTLSDNVTLNRRQTHNSYNQLGPPSSWIPGILPQRLAAETWQHDQREPVRLHDTFDQRKPVVLAPDHDSREPVPFDEGHDQRWEVPVEDTHDERSPIRHYDVITNEKRTYDVCLERHPEQYDTLDEYNVTITVTSTNTWLCLNNSTMIPFHSYVELKNEEHVVKNISNDTDIRKVCGRPWNSRNKRTVGGRKSPYSRWPWMMALLLRDGHSFKRICSAILLNEFWAITAAHCVYGKRVKDIVVQFVRSSMINCKSTIERYLYGLTIHPEFDFLTYENDLALMKFEEPLLQWQENTIPVCLPSQWMDIAGRAAVVTGWESSPEENNSLSELYELHVPLISNSECERMYRKAGYSQIIQDVFLCAGLAEGGFDACQGDSGGPMVMKDSRGRWTLIGLVSWGIECAAPNQPGVYTRILKFKDWINNIVTH